MVPAPSITRTINAAAPLLFILGARSITASVAVPQAITWTCTRRRRSKASMKPRSISARSSISRSPGLLAKPERECWRWYQWRFGSRPKIIELLQLAETPLASDATHLAGMADFCAAG